MPPRTDDYYESAAIWQRPLEPYQVQVIADVRQLLPKDISCVLDVGCGDGVVLRELDPRLIAVGVDGSREALRHVPGARVRGSVVELPFGDRSFDLVMANDVFEHLDTDGLAAALREMRRVASRYVLVTVPLREQLARSSSRCANCGAVVHANRHLRSVTELDLTRLAGGGFVAVELRYSGGLLTPPLDPFAAVLLDAGHLGSRSGESCLVCGAAPAAAAAAADNTALDAARARRWWGRDPAGAVHVDRSEAMVLLAREEHPRPAPSVEIGVRRTRCDLLEIDLANPLQLVEDWTVGATFARARLCGSARSDGDCVVAGASTSWLECCFPLEVRPGDVLEIDADGTPGCRAYTWDGAIGEERQIEPLGDDGRRFMIAFDPTPGSTGVVMNVHLGSDTRLRGVRLRAEGVDAHAPAFELSGGHSLAVLGSGLPLVTFGVSTARGGVIPAPRWDVPRTMSEPLSPEPIESAVARSIGDLLSCASQVRVRAIRRSGAILDRLAEVDRMRSEVEVALRASERRSAEIEAARDRARDEAAELVRQLIMSRRAQRILVCASWFPSDEQPGLGSFVFEQVKALREHTHLDVRVACGRPYWVNTRSPRRVLAAWRDHHARLLASSWGERDGVPLFEFPYLAGAAVAWLPTAFNYRRALRAVEPALFADFDYDLVHAHTAYVDGTAAIALARRRGVPCIVTEHTGPFSGLMRNRITRRITLSTMRVADRVWAVSSALLAEIRRWQGEAATQNLSVLHNGIDTVRFALSAEAETATQPERRMRFGAIGVFEDVKNPMLLLDAFALVRERIVDATLQLVGEGPLLQLVRARVEELGLHDAVSFRGRMSRTQVVEFLGRDIDALVVASRVETFGMAVVEAMSCGRPVVATRCGGPEDIVTDPALGRLVTNENVDALADGMLAVAQRRGEFDAVRIRDHVRTHFDLTAIVSRIALEYQDVARAHSRRSGRNR